MNFCQCDEEQKGYAQICCIGTSIIFFIIMLFACWDTVEPTEYGLRCSSISKQCSTDQVFEAGRHLLWPTNYFITFPGSLQSIEFSEFSNTLPPLKTRTAEGLGLILHLSFQYKLIKEQIPNLYSMNNLEYEATFSRIARDTILQAAGNYEAPSYWQERSQIGLEMRDQLNQELRKAHANCIYFQLLQIELPDSYEQSIVDTQVEVQQKKKMKEFEQNAQVIQQEINILRSKNVQKIKEINAQAAAQSYKIYQTATAEANQDIIESEANAYKDSEDKLSLSQEELNDYVYYVTLLSKNRTKLLIGADSVFTDVRGIIPPATGKV